MKKSQVVEGIAAFIMGDSNLDVPDVESMDDVVEVTSFLNIMFCVWNVASLKLIGLCLFVFRIYYYFCLAATFL